MDINKLYSVQYYDLAGNSCTIVGLFRDENTAIMFQNVKDEELMKKLGKTLITGKYIVNPLYTDFI
jgi:hypothetical protein